MKLFLFFSHKDMSCDEAKKVAYCSYLPHFSLSSMQEVVGEAILPNIFSKTVQLHLKVAHFLKKIILLVKLSYAK